jgi:hypothetical protein
VFTNRERCEVELKGYKKKNLVERLVRSIYGPAGLVSDCSNKIGAGAHGGPEEQRVVFWSPLAMPIFFVEK